MVGIAMMFGFQLKVAPFWVMLEVIGPVGIEHGLLHANVVKAAPVDQVLNTGVVGVELVQTCCACHSKVVPHVKFPN